MLTLSDFLTVENLFVSYDDIPIVRDVSFTLGKGEFLGVVGESGCGKSTMLRSFLMLKNEKTSIKGSISLLGEDITQLPEENLRKLRGADISMIPQNAFLSMDSTKTISSLFYETVRMHRFGVKRAKTDEKALQLMEELLLDNPKRILQSYPFELSGGMCQRVSIAVAMINQPKLILGDELTSALDVITQLQVVKQLKMLKETFHVSLIVVSHNLGVVSQLSDSIAIMYGGTIVEYGKTAEIFENPLHPYTKALICAIPNMSGHISAGLPGIPPVFKKEMTGCSFAERCPVVMEQCKYREPQDRYVSASHRVRCLHIKESVGMVQ